MLFVYKLFLILVGNLSTPNLFKDTFYLFISIIYCFFTLLLLPNFLKFLLSFSLLNVYTLFIFYKLFFVYICKNLKKLSICYFALVKYTN